VTTQRESTIARDGRSSGTYRLLDLDPKLARGFDERALRLAAERLIVPTETVARGEIVDFPRVAEAVVVLVADGALALRTEAAARRSLEMLPAGCFFRPGEDNPASFVRASFVALTETRLAIIDRAAYARLSQFPEITVEIISRLSWRARAAATQKAIDSATGLEDRVLLSLWHLAERCGHQRPNGIEIPIPFTHELFAEYLGAARPSVTSALRRLVDRGAVARTTNHGWLLRRDSLEQVLAQ